MRSSLMRREVIAFGCVDGVCGGRRGERHQSAPSEVAETEAAFTVPAENSRPALTHLLPAPGRGCGYGGGCVVREGVLLSWIWILAFPGEIGLEVESEFARCGLPLGGAPANITSPP